MVTVRVAGSRSPRGRTWVKGIAVFADLLGQGIDGLFDHVAIIDFTGRETHEREQRGAVDVGQMRFHIDRADRILNAFLDGDRDDVAALRRVELSVGADDAKIGIAVLEIEAADTFEVGGDPVGIVDVRRS